MGTQSIFFFFLFVLFNSQKHVFFTSFVQCSMFSLVMLSIVFKPWDLLTTGFYRFFFSESMTPFIKNFIKGALTKDPLLKHVALVNR